MSLPSNTPGRLHEESAATPERRFEARVLLDLKVSAHAELLLDPRHLRVRAAFGELIIPHAQIQKVRRGTPSSVAVEVAGAQLWLDVVKGSEVNALLAYLNERTSESHREH